MRLLLKWIGILVIVAAIAAAAAWLLAPRIAAHVIGSDLGTRATVDTFRVGFEETHFAGITIFSPSGSRIDPALKVKTGNARASALGAVASDPYVIDRVYMKDIELNFDFPMGPSIKSGNWGRMLNYSDAHADPDSRETKIRELVLENVQVTMVGADGARKTLKPIDRIRLTDVSSKTGVQKSQLASLVFGQIITQVLSLENLLPAIEKAAVQGVEGIQAGAKEAVSEATAGLKKGLGDLFGGSSQTPPTP
jgi:hypothetical protein